MYSSAFSSALALDGSGWLMPCRCCLRPGMTRYPLYRWAPGPVWKGAENLAPDHPALSESLYHLRYPGRLPVYYYEWNIDNLFFDMLVPVDLSSVT
jgi:hypothetical protein